MRIRNILAVVLASLAIPSLFGCAAGTESPNDRVDKLFTEWTRADSPGCSVGISKDGSLVYERGYGMANLELNVPITPTSVLSAASISKQFTAMSILLLESRGQLSLDDQVSKHIPEWADREHRVTIRHLLTHTSGLREGFSLLGWALPTGIPSDITMAPMLARQRGVNFPAGSEFQYNNGGYNLLGSIVRRVSGQPLADFAEANIFKPLGMTSTVFRVDSAMIVPNRATGYTRGANGRLQQTSEELGVTGNAGLYSTPRDLLKWERNFTDVRVGTPAIVAAMQTPAVLAGGATSPYGLGLFIDRHRDLRTVEHGGGDRGIAAYFLRFPERALGVAVLCNLDSINVHGLARAAADIYLADAAASTPPANAIAPPAGVALSAGDLQSKAGRYTQATGDLSFQLTVRDGKLIGRNFYGDDTDFELIPLSANRFFYSSALTFEFSASEANRGQEMRLVSSNGQMLEAYRKTTFEPAATDLGGLVGEYRSPDVDVTYAVVAADSGLVMQPPGRPGTPLVPMAKDVFAGTVMGTVRFVRDARGAVVGFTLNRYNARGVRFDRVNRAG